MIDLKAIVEDYIRVYRPRAKAEYLTFAQESSLSSATMRAALCMLPSGKRHPHQYRIPYKSLENAASLLLMNQDEIKNSKTFEKLHDLINSIIRDSWKVGELAVYDISTRIGAYLHLSPKIVYLHRGTREGAHALGFSGQASTLSLHQLPSAFYMLKPYEIEDCLCIYKNELKNCNYAKHSNCSRKTHCATRMRVKGCAY